MSKPTKKSKVEHWQWQVLGRTTSCRLLSINANVEQNKGRIFFCSPRVACFEGSSSHKLEIMEHVCSHGPTRAIVRARRRPDKWGTRVALVVFAYLEWECCGGNRQKQLEIKEQVCLQNLMYVKLKSRYFQGH